MSGENSEKKFKFYPSDFGPLKFKPLHFDLNFDVRAADEVVVTLNATYMNMTEDDLLSATLDAQDLKLTSFHHLTKASELGAKPKLDQELEADQSVGATDKKVDFVAHVASFEGDEGVPLEFEEVKDKNQVVLTFNEPLKAGQEIVIRSVSTAIPTANILEGIYFDYTPSGCPQTLITQCQQFGFQRIVPCVDRMRAKTYYTTTITADARYTNMITNGDLAPEFTDDGFIPKFQDAKEPTNDGHPRKIVRYYNHKVCMSPYLFFLGVGTYETHRRELEYADGDICSLELLTFPTLVEKKDANTAIEALHDSIIWTYLSTGPEAEEHNAERKELYQLIAEREDLKKNKSNASRLAEVRTRCAELIKVWKKTGYKYTGAIYREISMENSDYGGMENVGNTTILSSRMVPSANLTDRMYVYMEAVKIHEFYHNINGSQVTGTSPFEIWLNEAVTVHMERQRTGLLFGHDYTRLMHVTRAFTPVSGPLAVDSQPNSLAIAPEGFNRTQELISATTYCKAPEFVRMVQLLLSKPVFDRGLDLYHTRYSYANANSGHWIASMEAVSGLNLQNMANGWLRRTNYPRVSYSSKWNAAQRSFRVDMTQTGFEDMSEGQNQPWDIPIDWALVKDGKNIAEGVFRFNTVSAALEVANLTEEPDFISFARDWSFFGVSINKSATTEQLALQATSDPDVVNRYFAYRALADQQKINLVKAIVAGDSSFEVSEEYIALHAKILFDESATGSARATMLAEPAQVPADCGFAHHYDAIEKARQLLLRAVWDQHGASIVVYYHNLMADYKQKLQTNTEHKWGIHTRNLSHHLLNLISTSVIDSKTREIILNSPAAEVQELKCDPASLLKDMLDFSPFMSDQAYAFIKFLKTATDGQEEMRDRMKAQWTQHPDTIEVYIASLASLDTDFACAWIRELMDDPSIFKINQASHQRSLSRSWLAVRHKAMLSPDGLDLCVHIFKVLSKVNQMSCYPFLSAFGAIGLFEGERRDNMAKALEEMYSVLDEKEQASLYNQFTHLINKFVKV